MLTWKQILREWRGTRLQKEVAGLLEVNLKTYSRWEEGCYEPKKFAKAEIERRMTHHRIKP